MSGQMTNRRSWATLCALLGQLGTPLQVLCSRPLHTLVPSSLIHLLAAPLGAHPTDGFSCCPPPRSVPCACVQPQGLVPCQCLLKDSRAGSSGCPPFALSRAWIVPIWWILPILKRSDCFNLGQNSLHGCQLAAATLPESGGGRRRALPVISRTWLKFFSRFFLEFFAEGSSPSVLSLPHGRKHSSLWQRASSPLQQRCSSRSPH